VGEEVGSAVGLAALGVTEGLGVMGALEGTVKRIT